MVATPATSARPWTTYRVGLTGGIASGKSTVAELFAALGVPVIDTDVIARDVVSPGTPGLGDVVAAFGREVLLPDGGLDRRRLRDLVFAAPDQRRQLEAILHPRILERLEARCASTGGPYQLLVIPLLRESGLEGRVDRVLVVDCSEDIQRQRLMVRDGESAASADRILAAQLDRQARLAIADDVLANAGTRDDLARRVRELHDDYLRRATGPASSGAHKGGMKGAG